MRLTRTSGSVGDLGGRPPRSTRPMPYPPTSRVNPPRGLQRQFLVGREAVLPPAQVAVVLHRGLVHLQVAVAGGRAQRRRRASISAVAIGWKPRATARFWRRTARESMPLTVVATGRLMA